MRGEYLNQMNNATSRYSSLLSLFPAILVLYLTQKLGYNEETATVLFHFFTMLVYIFPLMGAVIADGWLGKYKTILYLSMVYSAGAMIVSIGAIPFPGMPVK